MKSAKKSSAVSESREKLRETPFTRIDEMKQASHEIRRRVWERLETARILESLTQKEEFKSIKEEFKQGLKCKYGNSDEHLVHVYSKGVGIEIDINPDIAKEANQSGSFAESLIRATGETFSKAYYQSKGILPSDTSFEEMKSLLNKDKL